MCDKPKQEKENKRTSRIEHSMCNYVHLGKSTAGEGEDNAMPWKML